MKKIRLGLVLSAALVAGGFSAAYSAPEAAAPVSGKAQALQTLLDFPGARLSADLPTPAPLAAFSDEAARGSHGGHNACTPSAALVPGSDLSPKIEDPVRVTAITELLAKIAACKPLPFAHDGITNTNTEGGMPPQPAGYYKEYTLMVPGRNTGDGPVPVVIGGKTYMTGNMLSARGPERLLIGGGRDIYYTPDHYKSFINLTIVRQAPSRVVQPGTSILPVISDQGRVQTILELIQKIHDNTPLPYSHDGITYNNKEGHLPQQPTGFYKEYTLIPPANSAWTITIGGQAYQVSPNTGGRGAERIIIGNGELVYYTPDHYRTFIQLTIVQ
jgi:guanyl-specific ribonuclease Sa